MKFFFLALLLSYGSYASAEECVVKSDVDSLLEIFKANDKKILIDMSADSVRHDVETDDIILNKKSTLINISDVSYGWGVDEKSTYPIYTSPVPPSENICVWTVSFSLPEPMRKKCDDDGAYGYFIDFKKINGKMVLYKFSSLFDPLSDGSLACKAANKFMLIN